VRGELLEIADAGHVKTPFASTKEEKPHLRVDGSPDKFEKMNALVYFAPKQRFPEFET